MYWQNGFCVKFSARLLYTLANLTLESAQARASDFTLPFPSGAAGVSFRDL